MDQQTLTAAAINLALTHDLLEGDVAQKRALSVELALDMFIGPDPAREDVAVAGLRCPTIEAFLELEPCSRFVSAFKGQPLQLYVQTMRSAGYHAVDMTRNYEARDAVRKTGGTVLARVFNGPKPEPCTICDPQVALGLVELEQLPTVPLHWGCRCTVLSRATDPPPTHRSGK